MINFSDLNVLIIGDVCLDVTEEGKSYRQSPEAPVPIILNPKETYSLGMAANVALNLKKLGADIDFIFIYGEDYYGEIFGSLLEEKFGPIYFENIESNTSTIVKKRILANGNQVARIDFEDKVDEADVNALIEELDNRLFNNNKYDLIIISDYNKGIITKESWKLLNPILKQLSDNFYVDTKKKNILDFYEGMYIFPNKKEMEEIMEYNNCSTRNELRLEMDLDFIIETASEEGAYLYKDDGKIYHCPVFKSRVVDVTGCGDTFISAFSLYYTKYKDKKEALGFANYCCSKVIEKKGTTPITISEVQDFHDIESI